jgi:hypothetical protein
VGEVPVHSLSQPLLTCFLAVHASHHLPHLAPLLLAELVLLIQADGGARFPWTALAERFDRTGLSPFGYPALALAEALVPGTVDRALLERLRAAAPAPVRRLLDRVTPATAFQMYHRSFEARFLWAETGWRRMVEAVRWLWPRDGSGARVPPREAVAVTGVRLRRLLGGRFRRRML